MATIKTALLAVALGFGLAACEGEMKAPTLPSQVFNICEETNKTVDTTFTNQNNCVKNNVEVAEEEEAVELE